MARIRSVKMGFFRNEHLAAFSFAHRLLFEGLWIIADREGRLEDRPKRIKADLFPFDDDLNVGGMLSDLAAGDDPFIERYIIEGRNYIQVLNFARHQRPNSREPESEIPSKYQLSMNLHAHAHADTRTHAGKGKGKGREGEGNGVGEGGEHDSLCSSALTVLAVEDISNHDLAVAGATVAPEALMGLWNTLTVPPLPKCRELTDKRAKHARARLHDAILDEWAEVIERINASDFCRGTNDRGWIATFDWLLQPDVRVKVLEGKYDDRAVVDTRTREGRNVAALSRTLAAIGRGEV